MQLFIYLYTFKSTFKAFPVSKINSETSFLYQLFKDNLNFIVLKPCKVIYLSTFIIFIIIYIYSYVYLCIYTPSYQHFKAFPLSNFNSKRSFLYQLLKKNSNFILVKPCKVVVGRTSHRSLETCDTDLYNIYNTSYAPSRWSKQTLWWHCSNFAQVDRTLCEAQHNMSIT